MGASSFVFFFPKSFFLRNQPIFIFEKQICFEFVSSLFSQIFRRNFWRQTFQPKLREFCPKNFCSTERVRADVVPLMIDLSTHLVQPILKFPGKTPQSVNVLSRGGMRPIFQTRAEIKLYKVNPEPSPSFGFFAIEPDRA